MKNKIYGTSLIIFSLALGIICLAFLFKPMSVYAFNLEIVGDNNGISITHDNPLFDIKNFVPGETKNSALSIKNNGDGPLTLDLDSLMENGDLALFEKLEFTIENSDGFHQYYSGTLNKLNHINLGDILPGEEKTFNLSVSFPSSSGNEFQQKAVSVSFIFTANGGSALDSTTEATNSTVDFINESVPLASVPLPETGTTIIPQTEIPTTGESDPKIWYIFGLLLVAFGLKAGVKIFTRKDKA